MAASRAAACAACLPASTFRGLQESLINYGGNTKPELLTCCHEESSVAMAHGYAKIEGKPMMIMAHGTVGLQHAAACKPATGLALYAWGGWSFVVWGVFLRLVVGLNATGPGSPSTATVQRRTPVV